MEGLLRGAGAPGYISHYCLFFVTLIDISIYFDSTLILAEEFLMVLRYDFAVIMLCSDCIKHWLVILIGMVWSLVL